MIRKAEIKDLPILAESACQLWPDNTVEEMQAEFAEIIAKPDATFFWHMREKLPLASPNASCGTTMWRGRIPPLLDIWKASMWRMDAANRVLPESFSLPAKAGQR